MVWYSSQPKPEDFTHHFFPMLCIFFFSCY
ncbi:hypothetical protein PDIG_25400 [Penicillium digitatum PHI26]|uniref:Uncharacterized protein n=2 Tax=Penicillium digitatum TaxID=36651 RepID=K9G3R5_PEND2|nr:hypothetical protein PDIP_59870 [Penicillium digitatum Pd1]EKV10515.1 hypothetical protein PDIP_59870 [Penicillium digitatum Pd1]EKV15547.1 hypothetical protein PDIG_25400 [Penicillium digitatum PHI26]